MTWICKVCGYEHGGDAPPEECPVCGAPKEDFERVDPSPSVPQQPAAPPARMDAGALRCAVCVQPLSANAARCPTCGSRSAWLSPPAEPKDAGRSAGRSYVIAGGGVAGWNALERIRLADAAAQVTLITAEPAVPYFRLSLTRYLGGDIDAATLFPHSPEWYADQRMDLMFDTEVLALDREHRVLHTSRGTLPYDRLVIATGSRPFVPPLKNLSLRGVSCLRTLPDVQLVLGLARPNASVVVIGGGVLGLETAFSLRRRGCNVTVCEGAPQLLSRQLDAPCASILQAHLETKGIQFVLGDLPTELIGDESVRGVKLSSGRTLDGDIVIVSAGVRPNTLLWARAGLKVERGIVVDDSLQTSDPNVWAAGDVAEHAGVVYGIWPAAQEMGRVAGTNAAGGEDAFGGIPMSHSLKVVDLDVFSIGTTRAEGEAVREIARSMQPPRVEKIFARDGIVVGGILMGDTSRSGLLRSWVQEHKDISGLLAAQASPDQVLARLAERG